MSKQSLAAAFRPLLASVAPNEFDYSPSRNHRWHVLIQNREYNKAIGEGFRTKRAADAFVKSFNACKEADAWTLWASVPVETDTLPLPWFPKHFDLPLLYIAIQDEATGKTLRTEKMIDPREAFCNYYNATSEGRRAVPMDEIDVWAAEIREKERARAEKAVAKNGSSRGRKTKTKRKAVAG